MPVAAVTMILDFSTSMGLCADSSNPDTCASNPSPDTDICPTDRDRGLWCSNPAERRSAYIKDAVESFVDNFTERVDYFSFRAFSARDLGPHYVEYPMRPLEKADIISHVRALSEDGHTDPATPLQAVQGDNHLDIDNSAATIPERAIKVLVLFTDGSPTLDRGIIDAPFLEPNYLPDNQLCDDGDGCDCDESLYFHSPDWWVDSGDEAAYGPRHFKRYVFWPIRYSDEIKQAGVTIFTIGLGDNYGHFCDADGNPDPMQAIFDPSSHDDLRSNFLARIANDPNAGTAWPSASFRDINCNGIEDRDEARTTLDFDDECVPRMEQIRGWPVGGYYETPSVTELAGIFNAIAQRIKAVLSR